MDLIKVNGKLLELLLLNALTIRYGKNLIIGQRTM